MAVLNGPQGDVYPAFPGLAELDRVRLSPEIWPHEVTLTVVGVEYDGAPHRGAAEVGGNGFNGPSHFSFDLDGPMITRMTIRA